jgi:7,8-dihydropterin-6-yl-methyl-4-(beta-D-ribofuranosyl)aminobenzene 5'-phosphate synthase
LRRPPPRGAIARSTFLIIGFTTALSRRIRLIMKPKDRILYVMKAAIKSSLLLAFVITIGSVAAQSKKVEKLKVTILSTMLADKGIGEWGFSALIEVDGRKMLFDTGARPETVLQNAKELGIDLSDVEQVFMSHGHSDHTGGLITLRNKFSATNPKALSIVHIGEGAFFPRPEVGAYAQSLNELKSSFEKSGGKFIVYKNAQQIYPGMWITGPVPRTNDEKNWSGAGKVELPDGQVVPDNVPEDQSLVFDTKDGLVVVSGCGHAGVVNTVEYARQVANKSAPVTTLIGGFHLFNLSDEKLGWTAEKLKTYGLQTLIGAHCTGIDAVFYLKSKLELKKHHAVVGSVGTIYELGNGITPGNLSK